MQKLRSSEFRATACRAVRFWRMFCALTLASLVQTTVCGQSTVALEPARAVRSGCEIDYPPLCTVDGDGRADGFSVELLHAALAAMGREVSFRTGPWADVKGWLERGEIDALPLVGRTPEREALFDFTVPYLTMHGAIVVRKDTTDVHDLIDLRGRQVAVMKGDNAEEFLRREERGFEILTRPTFTDALRELSAGRCDAVVMQRLVALRLLQKTELPNVRIIERPITDFYQDWCFAVHEGDSRNLALLNEGLALVTADGTRRRLYAKWFAELELPHDRPLVIGGDIDYPPYEFLDDKGRPAGYNVDLIRAVAHAVGLDIEIRLGPWSEIIRKLERGEIDAVQGMFLSTKRDEHFDFSQAHCVINYVSVVRRNAGPPPSGVKELKGLSLVVQEDDIMHDYVRDHGLTDNLTVVATQQEALRAVAAGQHDCALVARRTAQYWIEELELNELVLGRASLLSSEYCFAVPNGHKALLAQLSEGLATLEESGEYRRIHQKWMGVYHEQGVSARAVLGTIAVVIIPLLLVIALILLWSWSLRRQVAERTAELTLRTEELASQYRLLEVASDTTRFGGWSVDLATGATTWSGAIWDIHGLPRGHSLAVDEGISFYPPEWRDRITQVFTDCAEKGIAYDEELEIISRSGDRVWVRTGGQAIRDASGKIVRVEGSFQDITKQKQMEAGLRESRARFQSVIQTIPDLIWLKDRAGTYLACNPRFEQFFGASEAEIVGKTDYDFVSRELADSFRANDQNALERDLPTTNEEWVPFASDGHRELLETIKTPMYGADGQLVGVLGIGRNISERHKAEAEIESLARLANENPNPVVRIAADGTMTYANAGAGILLTGVLCANVGERVVEVWRDRISEALATEPTDSIEVRSEDRTFSVDLAPVCEHGYVNLYARDVTHERAVSEQLRQAQKLESIGRLAGGVAHDFNNLLMGIMNYVELCRDGIELDHPVRPWLDEITHDAQRSAGVTRQLLAFARKQTIAPQVLDLNDAVSGMLSMLRRLIGEDIDLAWKPGATVWPVKMDPSQIDQVLANLAVNARDAIGGVGQLTVETRNAAITDAYCADHPEAEPGQYVVLAVSDDGCGMDRETLEHAFEPFFTTKGVSEGTGLGLATIYGIAKQNNGFINVYSELGEGTTFRIYLPWAEGAVAASQADTETPMKLPRGDETILLVEDEKSIRVTAQLFLQKLGYTVLAADCPEEALRQSAAYSGEIHLLITDVVMPGMSGSDLAQRLSGLRPSIKCLFISGFTADVIAQRGILEDGMNFLAKPFGRDQLAHKVREVLDGRASEMSP